MEGPPAKRIPTSRFLPLELLRQLEVFGAGFSVEMSTGLTLNPDTVVRAAIGKSLQAVLRDGGQLGGMLAISDALRGKRQLTETTRTNALRLMGPFADVFDRALDGESPDPEWLGSSDWQCLASTFGKLSDLSVLDVVVSRMLVFDRAHDVGVKFLRAGDMARAERTIEKELDGYLAAWRTLCPDGVVRATLLLETSLRVLVDVERVGAQAQSGLSGDGGAVLSLLAPKSKPVGNWMRGVAAAAGCKSNGELSRELFVANVKHHERVISYDLLKGWASMRPSMLMTLDGCRDLLKVVPDQERADGLTNTFALARFLAFLCDLLRSSVLREGLAWKEAQEVLCARYIAILGATMSA